MASSSQGRPFGEPLWRTLAGLAALMLGFIVAGWPFMKTLGIEVDEALIGNGLYEHGASWYSWHIFGREIPVMLLSYLGAFKTWMYNPLFAIWPPGPVSLRLPMVLLGAVTVALFFVFLNITTGRRSAWIGACLLATDPCFVVSESIDFGFVAIQHALKLGALLLLVLYHRDGSAAKLAGGFFLFGLAMWDKAVFVWVLVAIVVAGGVVFWREIRLHLTLRNAILAGAAFGAGAFPLVTYNIARPLETVRQNVHLAPDQPQIKMVLLKRTLDGSGLFGYVTAPDAGPHPGVPHGVAQRMAFGISRLFRDPVTSYTGWALIVAILVAPFVWTDGTRRPLLFAFLFLVLTWLQMFLTTGAGGAVHHVILLWPLHLLIIAVVLSELVTRMRRFAVPLAAVGTTVLCVANLLVVNEYYVAVVQNGPGVRWTDAFAPLTAWLYEAKRPTVLIADWGMLETLNLLSEGELPLLDASFALRSLDQPQYREVLTHMLAAPGAIWINHGPGAEQWPGVGLSLSRFADSQGYSRETLHTVQDRNGRTIFEILRFRRPG